MSAFAFVTILLSVAFAVEGQELYDNTIEFCCDGKTYVRSEYETSELVTCCSQEVKDYTPAECKNPNVIKQECCGKKFSDIPTDANLICCGEEYINTKEYVCLKDAKVHLDKRNLVVGRLSICGEDLDNDFMFYNEAMFYNETMFYNEATDMCCGNTIYYDRSLDCCNGTVFNTSTHICCSDFESLEEPDENNLVYSIVEIPNSTIPVTDYGCCNKEFMNMETQVCCKDGPKETNGEAVKYCCGNEFVYDEKTQLCVNDEIKEREKFQNVCKDQVYNETTQHCYKGKLINLEEGQAFCESTEQPYSKKEELCCPNGVYQKTKDAQNSCCTKGKFDYYVRV